MDVPQSEEQYVVEGRIEQGGPPLVLLTTTQPYFEETDEGSYEELFVHDADIEVRTGGRSYGLQEICSSQVPDSLLGAFSQVSGLDDDEMEGRDVCIYTSPVLTGEVGERYELIIDVNGDRIRGETGIPNPVPLDSAWFETYEDREDEGFAWAVIDDPDTSGNQYRWYAKRVNEGSDGDPVDPAYVAPMGSVLDDRFFNGKRFEFSYQRGGTPGIGEPDRPFYEVGDTIAVKFTSIEEDVFQFYRTFEETQFNTGNPFAAPTEIRSNVDSALGIWAGFGVHYDTIVAEL